MEIETLKTMNEGLHPILLMVMKTVALITITLSIIGLAIYLLGIGWLCIEEMRQSLRRRLNPALNSPMSGRYKTLAEKTARNYEPGRRLTGSLPQSKSAI
ncbi:MAG: hypothetical protein AB7P14_12595 [Blastocatellales bacterium]